MFHQHKLSKRSDREGPSRGQSVVEFALVLPILMLIVAGTLEVGNLLTFYNRVQLAAREGARFAAAGGSDVASIVAQTSRLSLDTNSDFMTIWVVRPTISAPSADKNTWSWSNSATTPPWGIEGKCISGDLCNADGDDFNMNPVTAQRALNDIKDTRNVSNPEDIDGTTFATVVVYYEVDTILNLPFWRAQGTNSQGRVPIWAYGIMAQEIENETVARQQGGCSAYSMAVERNNFVSGLDSDNRVWLKLNEPDAGLNNGFYFVGWRVDQDVDNFLYNNGTKVGSLKFPGTSLSPTLGYVEYDGNQGTEDADTSLHIDDWVTWNKANEISQPNQPLYQDPDSHMGSGRQIRVLIYDYSDGSSEPANPAWHNYGEGPSRQIQISGFAIVRIVDEDHTGCGGGNPTCNSLQFEFIRWDNSCGQPDTEVGS